MAAHAILYFFTFVTTVYVDYTVDYTVNYTAIRV